MWAYLTSLISEADIYAFSVINTFRFLTVRLSALQDNFSPLYAAAFNCYAPVVSLLLADTRVDVNKAMNVSVPVMAKCAYTL